MLKMIQALSYKQTHSERLVGNGAVPVILRVMLNDKSSQGQGRRSLVSLDSEANPFDSNTGNRAYDPLMAESTRQVLGGGVRTSIPSGEGHSSSDHPPSPPLRPSSMNGAPDSPVTTSWKLVDVDLALYSCRTLTNFASWSALRRSLVDQGVMRVMSLFKDHHDLRVGDSAHTCLLLLDETKENEEAKIALMSKSDEDEHDGQEGEEQE